MPKRKNTSKEESARGRRKTGERTWAPTTPVTVVYESDIIQAYKDGYRGGRDIAAVVREKHNLPEAELGAKQVNDKVAKLIKKGLLHGDSVNAESGTRADAGEQRRPGWMTLKDTAFIDDSTEAGTAYTDDDVDHELYLQAEGFGLFHAHEGDRGFIVHVRVNANVDVELTLTEGGDVKISWTAVPPPDHIIAQFGAKASAVNWVRTHRDLVIPPPRPVTSNHDKVQSRLVKSPSEDNHRLYQDCHYLVFFVPWAKQKPREGDFHLSVAEMAASNASETSSAEAPSAARRGVVINSDEEGDNASA